MEKAQEILKHIDELYLLTVDLGKIQNMPETNPTQYQAWVDAFKDYDLSDILLAIDEFWEFKNSKTKPNVAQIKAMLNAKSAEKIEKQTQTVAQAAKGDFAWQRMNADMESGNCRNNLYVYRDAEKIILSDWLLKEIPVSVWASMSRERKIAQAFSLGLYDLFDEALKQAAKNRCGREWEFESENDITHDKGTPSDMYRVSGKATDKKAQNVLASHWR